MSRDIRVQNAGYHFISNRSVALRKVFVVKDDYAKFVEILSNTAKSHLFKVQAYTLLQHGYYLLIKTEKANLSILMKLLNRAYSVYFNAKYGRNGALWEGRFKSSYMQDEGYLFYFMRYMEHLPKMTGITFTLKDYPYSSYRQFVGLDKRLEVLEASIVFERFNSIEEIKIFFMQEVNKEFIENIIGILQNKKIEESVKKEADICDYLLLNQSEEERVKGIFLAWQNGISQTQIAKFLGMSQQMVSLKIKSLT